VKNQPSHSNASRFVLLILLLIACSTLGFGQGSLNTNPSTVNFGRVAVGSSLTRTLAVTNNGQSTWTINSAVANGSGFTISEPSLPVSLAPGASAGFTVTFAPAGSGFSSGHAFIRATRLLTSGNARSQSLVVRLFGAGTGSGSGTPPPTLQSIALTPTAPSVAVGGTQQFVATGTFSDASTQVLTSGLTWASSSADATVDATGLASGVAVGSAIITATQGSVTSNGVSLTVTAPAATVTSITVTPTAATILIGKTQQYAATAHFSDGSTKVLTSGIIWGASNPNAAISSTGVATGIAAGSATITAKQGSVSSPGAGLKITAEAATLSSIAVTPVSASIAAGKTQQFTATGTFSDGTTQVLTTGVTWGSSSADATISASGLATGVSAGTATITAAQGGVTSGGAALTVTAAPPTLTSISLSPTSASITVGKTQQFAATGHFSDGTAQVLTTGLTWASSTADATVSPTGLASGVTAGSATITAAQGGITSSGAALTVTAVPVTLTSIAVAPGSASIAVGKTQQFTATGNFSDGSSQDLSASATWKSSNATDATVSSTGLATGVAAGSVTVTAAQNGITSNPAVLAVTAVAATLQSISLTPATASVSVSSTQQFTATGHFSDNSTQTLTTGLTWASSSADATVSSTGLATGVTAGSANITATSGSVESSAAALTVTASSPVTANAFYVATTGSDSNPGTLTSPWKTIQHAASTVQAGDTVYIRGGTYTESVSIGVSGSATAGPVTFQSYPGEQAIIDGTGLTPSTSDVQGLINIVSRSFVTINGLEIQNYQTSNANAVPAGIWITGSGSNIQILNNIVHDIVTTSEANGNAFGIAVYGSGSTATTSLDSVTLSGNQVYNLRTGESESVNVDGNVTNFVISHNVIHDNDNIGIDAIGFEGVSSNSAVDFARNGEISDNTVYNISAKNNAGEGNDYDANGIYVDGGSQIVIERNIIHNVDIGIEMASEHSGHNTTFVTTRDNVVYAANSVGISIGGYANNVGGTDSCTIVNNTLFENDTKNTGSGEFQIQFHATNNVFENNIVYSTSQGLLINSYTNSTPDPAMTDFNIYFSAGGAGSADFLWIGSDHSGLAAYQSASGNDAHSQYVDPQFLSLTTPDLQVSATSPAIGTGTDLGTAVLGSLDAASHARVTGSTVDIGAYQQ
jgi:uncharacterized protein YjdB